MKASPVLLLLLLVGLWGPSGTRGAIRRHRGSLLYPFGTGTGDAVTPHEDDGMSPEIHLWENFSFYGRAHGSLYVNNNGGVSFGVGVPEFTPEPFPLSGHRPFVAPFWADVDNRLEGNIFYRQSREPKLLSRLEKDLKVLSEPSEMSPRPTWAFVATWDGVSYFGSASKKVNTFQAVLATDGTASYVMFNYGDLQWTTGIANHGNAHSGLGGLPAQAGFNSGDDVHFFNLPGSRTPEVLNISRRSNVGVPGRWIFRVDEFLENQETPRPPETTTTSPMATEEKVYICE
ncbi:sushi, nidogen and EGF-like domain-containing protein 1 [Cuculus canorus]|uniref:sushi, nidogen and EGF-like domain-containing protein 1 n=1 Tax=Cuculus canorus TaxID=55661 RepID=UPI0023AA7A3D|nr:sushi, nidogen and EGF-like domain-containing protein 1 [Cuculus canorus]